MKEFGDGTSDALFRRLTTSWEKALNDGHCRDVILGGLAAYCRFHDAGERTLETATLMYVRQAIEEHLAATLPQPQQLHSQQPSCSFCGLAEPEVRLAAGAKAFVCDSCVRRLGDVFKQ